MIKMLDIKLFSKMLFIYEFLIVSILIDRNFRIIMELGTVNKIVSIDFT